jgi:hypothetical protein
LARSAARHESQKPNGKTPGAAPPTAIADSRYGKILTKYFRPVNRCAAKDERLARQNI